MIIKYDLDRIIENVCASLDVPKHVLLKRIPKKVVGAFSLYLALHPTYYHSKLWAIAEHAVLARVKNHTSKQLRKFLKRELLKLAKKTGRRSSQVKKDYRENKTKIIAQKKNIKPNNISTASTFNE